MTAAMLMARIVGYVHTMSPIISMTLKYKLLTFKRNVNFAIVLGGELNSYAGQANKKGVTNKKGVRSLFGGLGELLWPSSRSQC